MGYQRLLLVEGRNDQYVLREVLRQHHIPCAIPNRDSYTQNTIVIEQAGSIERLLESLEVILEDGDLQQLGIVVDADTDLSARWDAVRNILARFGGKDLPQQPHPNGVCMILEQPYRELPVGVWLMPDNQVPGILENFVSFLVPKDDAFLWQRARDCVNAIPVEQRHFREIVAPKAQLHTWLAWQAEPGQPLGIAITAKYLDAHAPHATTFIHWVARLFALT